jgi:hypothetical protein
MVDLWINSPSGSVVDSFSFVPRSLSLALLPLRFHYGHIKVFSSMRFVNSRPLFWTWEHTAVSATNRIPEKLQIPLAAVLVIAVFLIGTFASPQSSNNTFQNRGISIAGLVVFYAALYLTSANRKRIVWRTVLVGLLCQYVLALFVLRTQAGYDIFNFVSFLARYLMLMSVSNYKGTTWICQCWHCLFDYR